MIGGRFFSRLFLVLPPGMSDAEEQAIIEQARREAFTRDDASAIALFTDALITFFTILFTAVSIMLAFAVFVGEDTHILTGPILIALIIVFAATLASLVRKRQRAKLLNPMIRELLKARDAAEHTRQAGR
jgi:hypothetical protein